MQDDKSIMQYESVLPADFDGVFRFSNPSKEDFVGVWGGKEYYFPAESTTPMVMVEHSPLEVQYIRKKFARDLAEREFFKSKGYQAFSAQEGKSGDRRFNSIHQAATYTIKDLEPFIQDCLKPLRVTQMLSREVNKQPLEEKLSRNEEGNINTEAIDSKTSLRNKALQA